MANGGVGVTRAAADRSDVASGRYARSRIRSGRAFGLAKPPADSRAITGRRRRRIHSQWQRPRREVTFPLRGDLYLVTDLERVFTSNRANSTTEQNLIRGWCNSTWARARCVRDRESFCKQVHSPNDQPTTVSNPLVAGRCWCDARQVNTGQIHVRYPLLANTRHTRKPKARRRNSRVGHVEFDVQLSTPEPD